MKWSKLKKLVEDKFASSLDGRISIYSTRYGNCSCGHAWLTLDKDVIANFFLVPSVPAGNADLIFQKIKS